MANEKTRKEIEKEAKRIKEDAEWTFKSQYNDSDWWRSFNDVLSFMAVISATVAGFSAIKEFEYERIVVVLAALLSALCSATLSLIKPLDKANTHHKAGVRFQALRDEARIFYNIRLSQENVAEEELMKEVRSLSKRISELKDDSPQPSERAYKKTRKGMEEGQADYEADKED